MHLLVALGIVFAGSGCGEGETDVRTPTAERGPLDWSVDTVSSIGVMAGEAHEEFGRLVDGELTDDLDVILLALSPPGLSAFRADGSLLGQVRSQGESPGELFQPMSTGIAEGREVLVFDAGTSRLSRFRVDSDGLGYVEGTTLNPNVRSVCALGGDRWIGHLDNGKVAHRLDPEGEIEIAVGPAPDLEELEELGGLAPLAHQQVVGGRLYCDETRGRVVVAGAAHPLVRAYSGEGEEEWATELEDIHRQRFRLEEGTLRSFGDPEHGTSFVGSLVRWNADHLLIQYQVRREGPPPDDRDFHAIDSRLLSLESGEEVARSDALPWIVASRDEHFLIVENTPFPRAVLVEHTAR